MKNNDFRVRFSKASNGRRQAALVTIKDIDRIYFGISKCHPKKDTFNKELAVEIAYGRAEKAIHEFGSSSMHNLDGNFGVVVVNRAKEMVEHFYKFTKSHRSK